MLKVTKERLLEWEQSYPGIEQNVLSFEKAEVPVCSHCGSPDTALVQCGVIGRTILIATATTKFKLTPNPLGRGKHFCNACDRFFP